MHIRQLTLQTIFILLISMSCKKESGSITGSWVRGMEGQPQHSQGFSLKDDGSMSTINMIDRNYEKWEKFGDRLILFGKYTSDVENSGFTDTLKIVSVNDSLLVLKETTGQNISYEKTIRSEQIISDYQIYDCYAYISRKDTAFMHINVTKGIVSGSLEYRLYEKDSNDGRLDGKISGDTLIANYRFSSEGTESNREIVLLKKSDDWLEGFGETEDRNGTTVFKDRDKLNFRKGLLFRQTACP